MMIYLEGFSKEFLPAWCNWLCETPPLWDEAREIFVEPYVPHTPIGVMHLSGLDDIRLDKTILSEFQTMQGSTFTRSYRFSP